MLYVSDQPANALLIVDLGKRAQVGTVPLGESPEGVGISAAGDWVVAASEITNSVSFISTATNQKVFSIKTAEESGTRGIQPGWQMAVCQRRRSRFARYH